MERVSLGVRIKQARKRRRLRQEDVAESVGVTRWQVMRWELDRQAPQLWHAKKLAQALAMSPIELLSLAEEAAPRR